MYHDCDTEWSAGSVVAIHVSGCLTLNLLQSQWRYGAQTVEAYSSAGRIIEV